MDILVQIATVLTLLVFLFLGIRLISFINKAEKAIDKVNLNLERFANEMVEVKSKMFEMTNDAKLLNQSIISKLDEISEFKEKAIETLNNADNTAKSITELSDNINNKLDSISELLTPFQILANKLYNQVAPPINNLSAIFSASSKAISVFMSKLSK